MTPKQQRFVQEYLIDLNATQAAIRAGYSEKTAYSQGQRLLKKVELSTAIKAAQAKTAERTEYTLERIAAMLEEDRTDAKKANQVGAAVTATMGLAKLHGLIIDRSHITHKNLDRGEREARIAELLNGSGADRTAGLAGAAPRGNGAGKPH